MNISCAPKMTLITLVNLCFSSLFFTVNAQQNLSENRLGVSGYDLVEYFNGNAYPGNPNFKIDYKGVLYQFKNQVNKNIFNENPEVYLPQYGGWCAYAMGYNGKKVEINPESFSIENNKLYLFYKTIITDTKKKWLKNNQELKMNADQNWNKLINK
ncbi:MAG: YHS domain-containing (seleno)protein [Flavobacteriaceae bacterium]|nr:YHS domain-containing (seleno)protein [Flavobacteriaceae bacterium]